MLTTAAQTGPTTDAHDTPERVNCSKPEVSVTFKDVDRFWSKVDLGEPDECWTWLGARGWTGHGKVSCLAVSGRKSMVGAHRVAWAIENGGWPARKFHVHHTCNNGACVNPAHLDLLPAREHGLLHARYGCKKHGFKDWQFRPGKYGTCRVCRRQRETIRRAKERLAA